MPDAQFADERLASLYDIFEGDRADLDPYLALARRLGAGTILDIGCGTGAFALMAAAEGHLVTGVDPAAASIAVARTKPGAAQVTWNVGTAAGAPNGPFDLALMTGNVAQVFLDDDEWLSTLAAVRERLSSTGHLVFETRRPEARAWEGWAEPYEATAAVDGIGTVRQSRLLLAVDLPLVSFRWRYELPGGTVVDSDSTLRFRGDVENRDLLARAGLRVDDVREAPDRPGLERVYVASPA